MRVTGIKEASDRLKKLGLDVKFATVKALNDSAEAAAEAERREIRDSFDRPTPYIEQRGVRVKYASMTKPEASVYLPGEGENVNVAGILGPHISGGGRRIVKASERRLRRFGLMRPNQYIVPGPGVPKDQYGNVSGPTMVKILSQLQAFSEAGYSANAKLRGMTWKHHKQLGSVYAIPGVGVFGRKGKSGQGVPLLFFASAPQYEAERFDFYGTARGAAKKEFEVSFRSALAGK